jgi:hypothetical protein
MDGGPPVSSAAAGSVASANKSIETGGTAVGTVDHDADEVVGDGRFERLPQRVQEALGELAGAAREGLLALSVGVGLGVLHEMMEAEVDEVVGPKGRHDPDRTAVRHGHENGEVTLGAAACPSAAHGRGPLTATARSSWVPTRTSPRVTRSPT